MNVPAATTFAVITVAMLIAHQVADHWFQTDEQARDKGLPGARGRIACLAHVLAYTATLTAAVVGVQVLFDLPLHWYAVLAGQVVSAGTHYWADRRFTLERLCERLGKGNFYRLGRPRQVKAFTGVELARVQLICTDRYEFSHGETVPWDNPSLGTGAYALDQSWHWLWIGVAGIVTVIL